MKKTWMTILIFPLIVSLSFANEFVSIIVIDSMTIELEEIQEEYFENQIKLEANDKKSGDNFGWSVSISENRAIIGSPFSKSRTGSAYIYEYEGSDWTQKQKLVALDQQIDDRFGFSVSISGNTAIVGAPEEDTGGSKVGAAYIYQYNGSKWNQKHKLQPFSFDKESGDNFGHSVAISGDTAIVGAPGESTGGGNAGAAYIYKYNGSIWLQTQKIQASDKRIGDFFGLSVAISGNTAIVSSPHANYGGSVYIYQYNGSQWIEKTKLQGDNKEIGDYFGNSVAISGNTAVVGVYGEKTESVRTGAAYIYQYNGSTWVKKTKLQASDKEKDDQFGRSVGISGDTVIVGAYGEDDLGNGAGSAYIYQYDGSNWVEKSKFQAEETEALDAFGISVGISGDTVIVGAMGEDTGGSNAGAAYIFSN